MQKNSCKIFNGNAKKWLGVEFKNGNKEKKNMKLKMEIEDT